MVQFAVMLAHPRSGTHLLRDAVNSHPDAVCPIEWFYRQRPTENELAAALAEFRALGKHGVLVDVKYEQCSDAIEKWVRAESVPVLHLVRRDIEAMWFSHCLRREMTMHPELETQHAEPNDWPALAWDLEGFLNYRDMVLAYREQFEPLETVRIYYEDLTGNRPTTALPRWAARVLCAILDVRDRRLVASGKKEAPTDYKEFWLK